MLAEIIEKIAGFEPRETPFYPRPSLAGPERCLRQLVYMARGFPGKKREDRLYVVLDDSSWHEELTLNWLRKSAFQVHSEQLEIECGVVTWQGRPFPLKGHVDAIITDLTGQDYLLEHKAVNHFSFQRYLEKDFPLDYLTQCTLYIVGLKKLNPEISKAILLIKNKNTSAYLEYLMNYDSVTDCLDVQQIAGSNGFRRDGKQFQGLYQQALERFNAVEKHRAEGTLPPRQYGPGDWQCEYCQYQEICYKGYEAELLALPAVDLPEQYGPELEEYISLYEQRKVIQERMEEIKEELGQFLVQTDARVGKLGEFLVERRTIVKHEINREKIPADLLPELLEEKVTEYLTIKRKKGGQLCRK